jgi:hypothetical protein
MSVTQGPPQVQKLFELTGADRLLNIARPSAIQRAQGLGWAVSDAA